MKNLAPRLPFQPRSCDAAGVVSWVHLGDLHMTKAGEQNHLDLAEIVDELNRISASTVSFVFLPGDVADDGSRPAYAVVRAELDRLNLPWCSILGDHDVHEKSFANFLETMSDHTHYAFSVGPVRFIAMNAFDVPHPASFTISAGQLSWVKRELQTATDAGQKKVLLLHCYPTDLKAGRAELVQLIRDFHVDLVDMGHTHYNELANDGRTLYAATRSTGQIEEGPVGYSIASIDGDVFSWKFVELGTLPVVVITSPADERLQTGSHPAFKRTVKVRAKYWGHSEALSATAHLDGREFPMTRIPNSHVWSTDVTMQHDRSCSLLVSILDDLGNIATDKIQLPTVDPGSRKRAERDQDNALAAWPEHGLLGTQLGPNKNGRHW